MMQFAGVVLKSQNLIYSTFHNVIGNIFFDTNRSFQLSKIDFEVSKIIIYKLAAAMFNISID